MSEWTSASGQGGALQGIRVVDVGLLVQGPQAAQLLGDLGAEVVKVELPGVGDQSRWIPISLEDLRAPFFVGVNRGKRSITLDLRRREGQGVFLRLADRADVVISNFASGTMERFGLGYEVLAERNPRIVYATGNTFGPLGPDAGREGADLAGQAAGGLIRTTGAGAAGETPVGVAIADHVSSQHLASGVLAALLARERTGRGQKVEVSLLGGQIWAQASEYTFAALAGRMPGPADGGHPMLRALYGVLPTADGHVAIVGIPVAQRDTFFRVIGLPELAGDERFAAPLLSHERWRELFDLLAGASRTKKTAEWERAFREAGLRHAAVRDYLEVARDPGVFENGYLQRVHHPEWGELAMVGCPIRLSDTPARPAGLAPELGQHTEEILLELGYDWDEIAALRDAGAL